MSVYLQNKWLWTQIPLLPLKLQICACFKQGVPWVWILLLPRVQIKGIVITKWNYFSIIAIPKKIYFTIFVIKNSKFLVYCFPYKFRVSQLYQSFNDAIFLRFNLFTLIWTLLSLKLQISGLFWVRSFLTFRQLQRVDSLWNVYVTW